MKKISIVIINYNGEKNTLECLESISQLSTFNYQLSVIIVDNASIEEFRIPSFGKTQDKNSKFKTNNIEIIKNKENFGFSGGNNVGIKYALENDADYIMLLNNDTIVDKNLVEELIKVAESDKKIGIISPKIYFVKGYEFHKDRYKENELGKVIWYAGGVLDWKNLIGSHQGVDEVDFGQYGKTGETDFATGCCMLIKREVFEKIGLLDEKYFLYYEDSDFNQRVKKNGWKIVYAPKAILWHKNAGSAGGSGSALQDYFITRNRMLFGLFYAPLRTKVALIKESITLLFKGRYWQKIGVLDFYMGRFRKGSYKII